ncbi:hypothetical protein BH23ACT2_BH23ACT2_04130 [soil metagenome]
MGAEARDPAQERRNNITLDQWDVTFGRDLPLFMEKAANVEYRVLAIVTSNYVVKANKLLGGVGYEKKIITPTIMEDLGGDRVLPALRDNPEGRLPTFMGAAWYADFRNGEEYEDRYFELLQALHRVPSKPKPPLGPNPFEASVDDAAIAVRHSAARYVAPAVGGDVTFDYSNNNGRHVIGAGDRAFTLSFSTAGRGSVHIYNDPPDIKTVALAAGAASAGDIGDASIYDGSSRSRTIRVGDAAILRNQHDYWAAVFVDEVHTRDSGPTGDPFIAFRYFITGIPNPHFDRAGRTDSEG